MTKTLTLTFTFSRFSPTGSLLCLYRSGLPTFVHYLLGIVDSTSSGSTSV